MLVLRPYQASLADDMQQCKCCHTSKDAGQFYVRKETGRLRSECKVCWNARVKLRDEANPERRRATALKWAKNNYPYIRSKKAEYRAKDPLRMRKWSLENPERKKALNKAWAEKNKPALAAARAKRRSALKLAIPAWANHHAIRDLYEAAGAAGLELDHIVPLQSKIVCGLHCESNLQALPQSANRKKSNRHWPDMP